MILDAKRVTTTVTIHVKPFGTSSYTDTYTHILPALYHIDSIIKYIF